MPSWDFASDLDLKSLLPDLGISDVFSDSKERPVRHHRGGEAVRLAGGAQGKHHRGPIGHRGPPR